MTTTTVALASVPQKSRAAYRPFAPLKPRDVEALMGDVKQLVQKDEAA